MYIEYTLFMMYTSASGRRLLSPRELDLSEQSFSPGGCLKRASNYPRVTSWGVRSLSLPERGFERLIADDPSDIEIDRGQ